MDWDGLDDTQSDVVDKYQQELLVEGPRVDMVNDGRQDDEMADVSFVEVLLLVPISALEIP